MNTYKRHRFPPDIISYAVWLYYRFNLSHRDIEDLLAERGIPVCQPDPIHSPFGINYISGPQILDSQHAKINIRAARHTGYT